MNPAAAAVTIMLRSLKMHGMAQAAAELTEQGAPAFQSAIPILSRLLKAELAEREVRSIACQLKAARFPTYKDLTGFDFASSQINEALARQLHAGAFMEKADNIVWSAGQALEKPMSPLRLASRRSSTTESGCGSTPRWNWSTPSSRRKPPEGAGRLPPACSIPTC